MTQAHILGHHRREETGSGGLLGLILFYIQGKLDHQNKQGLGMPKQNKRNAQGENVLPETLIGRNLPSETSYITQ